MRYGLQIELEQGAEDKLQRLILMLNTAVKQKAAICMLDNLDPMVCDYAFFQDKLIRLDDLDRLVNRLSKAVISIRMRYYPAESGIQSIHCYQDFLQSSCFLLVWGYDTYYYDVYCKDLSVLHCIAERAKMELSVSVRYIERIDEISKIM